MLRGGGGGGQAGLLSFWFCIEPGSQGQGIHEGQGPDGGGGAEEELGPAGVHRHVPHVPRICPHEVLQNS